MVYSKKIRGSAQAGATMIESLVALFVFSIGVLGLAALQTASLIQNDDAGQRGIAVWKAQELTDRILSTRSLANGNAAFPAYVAAVGAPNTNGIAAYDAGNLNGFCAAGPPAINCNAVACNSAQLATHDVYDVFCTLGSGVIANPALGVPGLIEPDVALVNAGGGVYQLYLAWSSRNAVSETQDGVARANDPVSLCGSNLNLDPRVNAICISFQ